MHWVAQLSFVILRVWTLRPKPSTSAMSSMCLTALSALPWDGALRSRGKSAPTFTEKVHVPRSTSATAPCSRALSGPHAIAGLAPAMASFRAPALARVPMEGPKEAPITWSDGRRWLLHYFGAAQALLDADCHKLSSQMQAFTHVMLFTNEAEVGSFSNDKDI